MRRLLVDARWFNGSGIGRYLGEVLGQVLDDGRFDRLLMLGEVSAIREFAEERGAADRVEALAYPTDAYSPVGQVAWLAMRARGLLRAAAAFFPHYDAPVFGMPERSVVSVHDLIHFEVPEAFPLWRRAAAGLVFDRVVRSAAHVLVLSRSTHRDLVRRVPSAEAKTSLVPLGIAPIFRGLAAREPPTGSRFEGLGPYLLCVGNRKPHKNLVAAVEALARLRRDRPALRLVFVGAALDGWDSIRRRAAELEVAGAVVDIRGVADAELAELYSGAEALLFPSLYEGLGLPVLEAMACGTPVVASDRSSIPEVVGDAALLVDPHDHAAMAEAVAAIMGDEALRADLAARGRRRFASYDWEASARRAVDLLDAVARDGQAEPRMSTPGAEDGRTT